MLIRLIARLRQTGAVDGRSPQGEACTPFESIILDLIKDQQRQTRPEKQIIHNKRTLAEFIQNKMMISGTPGNDLNGHQAPGYLENTDIPKGERTVNQFLCADTALCSTAVTLNVSQQYALS